MTRKHLFAIIAVMVCLALVPSLAFGAARFGMIFEIQGTATLTKANGKTTTLDRATHILKPVKVGETITVAPGGKVVVVAMADKTGFEITSGTTARITADGVVASSGSVTTVAANSMPLSGSASGTYGTTVLRSASTDSCVNIASPRNTAVLDTTPMLAWDNACTGASEVTVRIYQDRAVVFEMTTNQPSFSVPQGVLEARQTYRWMVETSAGKSGATFTTLDAETSADLRAMSAEMSASNEQWLPNTLAYIFMMVNQ